MSFFLSRSSLNPAIYLHTCLLTLQKYNLFKFALLPGSAVKRNKKMYPATTHQCFVKPFFTFFYLLHLLLYTLTNQTNKQPESLFTRSIKVILISYFLLLLPFFSFVFSFLLQFVTYLTCHIGVPKPEAAGSV